MPVNFQTTPTTLKRRTSFEIDISGVVTVPTTANTTVTIGGQPADIDNVYDLSGTYRIVAAVPPTLALQHDPVGYPINVDVNGENNSTGNIPLLPEPGMTTEQFVAPNAGSPIVSMYSEIAAAAGVQVVYTKENYPEGIGITIDSSGNITYDSPIGINSRVKFYFISAAGVVGGMVIYEELPAESYTANDGVSYSEGNQAITGTCSRLHTPIQVSEDSSGNPINFINVNKDWRVETDPFKIDPQVLIPSNRVKGTPGSYIYDHKPILMTNGEWLLVYRTGSLHTDPDGYLVCQKSSDLSNWSAPVTVANETFDTRNAAGGVDPDTGRVFVFFREYNNVNLDLAYKFSDDYGDTWSSLISLTSLLAPFYASGHMLPWGPLLKTDEGLVQTFYTLDACITLTCTDGTNFENPRVLFSGTNSSGFRAEPSPALIDSNRGVMYVRKQGINPGEFDIICCGTTDDGFLSVTHPKYNEIDYSDDSTYSPTTTQAELVGDEVFVAWGARKPVSEILVSKGSMWHAFYAPEDLIAENYPARVVVSKSSTNGTGLSIDFGMPHPHRIPGVYGKVVLFWYDNPDSTPNDDMAEIYIGTS